jgi:hypothetical protein
MKKLSALVVALIASVSMMAQGTWTLTPKVGITGSYVTGISSWKLGDSYSVDPDYKIGFTGGAEFGYKFNSRWAVTFGAMYSMQGVDIKVNKLGSEKTKGFTSHYINVPVLANFYITKGLAVKLGIQPGFLVAANYDGEDVKNQMNTFDFSIPVGVSYDFDCGLVLDARYNCGMTKIIKSEYNKSNDDNTNSVFSFTVGYKFKL